MTPRKSAAWPCCVKARILARAAVLPGPETTCMNVNPQFVDTNPQFVDINVLVYVHDVTAGDKHVRARALVEELRDTR